MRDLIILFEHPEWHEPLFAALKKRNVDFSTIDLKVATYGEDDLPEARLYYNMVSPSAYKRGNQRAIPYAYSICRHLESLGVKVLNGTRSMAVEMSKSAQISLLKKLEIHHPKSIVFNHIEALRSRKSDILFPAILKPEQGGSGARMYLANNWEELEEIIITDDQIWWPDGLLLIQEKLEYEQKHGIIRLEFLGGKFLYAMRVVTHDSFNLCPSLACNPLEGDGVCEIPSVNKPEFYPFENTSEEIILNATRILETAGHDSGSVEYCINQKGEEIIYDINANSNLRELIAAHFGMNPFERIVDFLLDELQQINN